jgi:glucosyl-dolichyl phosphate glucuronosyltransferase
MKSSFPAIDISVVICTYNRASSLMTTLDSLRKMSVPADLRWELILVDNNSSDNTRAVIEEFGRSSGLEVRYVFEGKQGLSHARNAGVGAARGEVIAFTDDDVTVDPKWVASLRQAFTQFNCTGAGGRTIAVWSCSKPAWFEDEGPYALSGPIISFDLGDSPSEMVQAPIGANMAYRADAFEKYGHFRTDLGRMGASMMAKEDTEFGRRLMKAGQKIFYVPDAVVYHPVESKRLKKSFFQSWYYMDGRAALRESQRRYTTVKYFGIPRFFFRLLVVASMKWLSAVDRRRRFYYKLTAYRLAGLMAEARHLSAEEHQRAAGQGRQEAG